MAIAGRASVSPRSAPITTSPSTSRLPTVSNRGLTSTMPRGFFRWRLKHSGLRRKLVGSRHSTLCRRSLDLQPCRSLHSAGVCHHRTRTPEPKAPRGIASQSAKPVLFNDIDRWVLRCALVVASPALDDDLGLAQTVEDLAVEQLVAKAGVEAFDVAVLPRTASLDVSGLGADSCDPFLHGLGDELRSVLGADVTGDATQDEEVGQNVDHIDRLEFAGDTDRQAFMVNSSSTLSIRYLRACR